MSKKLTNKKIVTEKELLKLICKNIYNMQEKLNLILQNIVIEEEQEENQMKNYDDKVVDIDKSTYERMCKMMKTKEIPFMGIA
tara:strand:+ start:458 stop:706 length:249 start_codon:yes stop_codon:yes gene_type:complete